MGNDSLKAGNAPLKIKNLKAIDIITLESCPVWREISRKSIIIPDGSV